MLTKAFKKEISSLCDSKGRRRLNAFMAEGTKCVLDTLDYFELRYLIATPRWLEDHNIDESPKVFAANRGEIGEMSSMVLAPDVIAVYDLPAAPSFNPEALSGQLVLALDRIQDPGNLGTIVRTADWMGVRTVLASKETVDCFNPKVVQATMGAISRVKVVYGDLVGMLAEISGRMPVFGTFLNGENIYSANLPSAGVILLGNEGKGISADLEPLVSRRLFIPPYPADCITSESLNVASAAAIVLSQFRSRISYGKD